MDILQGARKTWPGGGGGVKVKLYIEAVDVEK